ncbi:MAG: hypothetical protein ACD_55C00098G0003 [uncultured bacterium]|uniref:Sulfate adenylyltransferase, subunit 1 n=1 Tax=Citrifermentans bemidjiense (strain ATCC BAA-1014 / DSM 16622 / JCM 12645 / Bem) TaxID=404380 RepID=B5E9A5_CITBB|nr:GTP-binding protein [Citrifermentans bemidjiense]ACH38647.1 sulfate adenylyltransferase, subunit 1 [Citrifermentans bemidjiense Bem]EKD59256.1 MAG: hypothetical protein ACD_55C00098G0003 [uncultured bacterium]
MTDAIKSAFPIAITGHVDHGKSTLIGRLLYDTGTLQSGRYQEMLQSSLETGRGDEFAFVLDAFEEERRRGITIDTSQIYFNSKLRPYLIIDTPGHREFIRNMVTGASYAKAAVLIVDAVEGVMEQTRRHAWLLSIVGIQEICVAVNKMDAVAYSSDAFAALSVAVESLFTEFGLSPAAIVPISARVGDNVAKLSGSMPWYTGKSLLEVLDSLECRPIEERPFRFPVQDVYRFDSEPIVVGRIESGAVRIGEKVTIYPGGRESAIGTIRTFPSSEAASASYGEAIGFTLEAADAEIVRGSVIAAGAPPTCGREFQATVFWFMDEYAAGDPVTIRCTTQSVPGRILLHQVFDPAQPDAELPSDLICVGEAARCTILTEVDLAGDHPGLIPETGRFVIEREGIPAGAGIFR